MKKKPNRRARARTKPAKPVKLTATEKGEKYLQLYLDSQDRKMKMRHPQHVTPADLESVLRSALSRPRAGRTRWTGVLGEPFHPNWTMLASREMCDHLEELAAKSHVQRPDHIDPEFDAYALTRIGWYIGLLEARLVKALGLLEDRPR